MTSNQNLSTKADQLQLTYNQRYFPQENKLVGSGGTLVDQVYSEDAVGNITAITDALDSGYARSFTYDDLNRLTTANGGSKLWGTASGNGYTYDATGNMLSQRLGTWRNDTFSYQAGATGSAGLPMLSTVQSSGSTRSVSYDAAGSELTDGVNTLAYGARELLGSAFPELSAYAYDGFRRRVETQTVSGLKRVSLYDDSNHLLAESAASASPSSIAYDYVWFGDRPVAQLDTAATHWTATDHLGTPLLQTDSAGSVSWQAEYDPYGLIFALRGADVHQPLRLPGQEVQQFDTGASGVNLMGYNGARWYVARWGRYTQSDPIYSVTPYGYANANPLSLIDPSGMQTAVAGAPTTVTPIDIPKIPPVPWWLLPFMLLSGDSGPRPPAAAAVEAPYSVSSCPNPNQDPNCKDKVAKMIKRAASLEKRRIDMEIDKFDLYNLARVAPNPSLPTDTTWIGHVIASSQEHVNLWELYLDAMNAHCIIPPDLFRYVREIPQRPKAP